MYCYTMNSVHLSNINVQKKCSKRKKRKVPQNDCVNNYPIKGTGEEHTQCPLILMHGSTCLVCRQIMLMLSQNIVFLWAYVTFLSYVYYCNGFTVMIGESLKLKLYTLRIRLWWQWYAHNYNCLHLKGYKMTQFV